MTLANPFNSAHAPLNGAAALRYGKKHKKSAPISNKTGRPVAHRAPSFSSDGATSHGITTAAPAKKKDPWAGLDLDPSQPFSRKALKRYVQSQIALRYGAQEKSLDRTQAMIPGWYDNYRKTLSTSGANTVGAFNTAAGSMTQPGTNVAAAPDLGTDPTAVAAAGSVQADNAGFSNMLKTMAASENARYGELGTISQGDQIQQQARVRDALAQLQADKGAFRVGAVHDAIQAERDYGIQQAAFGADTQKTQFQQMMDLGLNPVTGDLLPGQKTAKWKDRDADHDGIPNGEDPRPNSKNNHPAKKGSQPTAVQTYDNGDVDGDGIPNARDPDQNPKKKNSLTPAAKRGNRNDWQTGLDLSGALLKRNPKTGESRVRLALTQSGVPNDIAAVAAYRATHHGMMTPAMAKKMRKLGITIYPDHVIHGSGGGSNGQHIGGSSFSGPHA
jgi:hypothetical protein